MARLLGEEQASGRLLALAAKVEAQLAESKRLSAEAEVLVAMTKVLTAEIDVVLARANGLLEEVSSRRVSGGFRAADLREEARLCLEEARAAVDRGTKRVVASRALALAQLAEKVGLPGYAALSPTASFPPQSQASEGGVEASMASSAETASIFLVDHDPAVRQSLGELLTSNGHRVVTFPSGRRFLAASHAGLRGCLVIDASGPGMKGIEVLRELRKRGSALPVLMTIAEWNVATAVQAMKAGARDFIVKPFDEAQILSVIGQAIAAASVDGRTLAVRRLASLTKRQREILDLIVAGLPNKEVAARLGINRRTVEAHRAIVMKKMEATSFADLVRLTFGAAAPALPHSRATNQP